MGLQKEIEKESSIDKSRSNCSSVSVLFSFHAPCYQMLPPARVNCQTPKSPYRVGISLCGHRCGP